MTADIVILISEWHKYFFKDQNKKTILQVMYYLVIMDLTFQINNKHDSWGDV